MRLLPATVGEEDEDQFFFLFDGQPLLLGLYRRHGTREALAFAQD